MVQIREFRIVLPMSVEEFEVGHAFTIMKMEQQNTDSQEGVELVENGHFEDALFGSGFHTSKIYHLQSKIPSWLKPFAPQNSLTLQEESWSAYPKSKTVLKCSFMPKFSLSILTVNKADNGISQNVHNLTEEQLALREVEVIDIASNERDYWSRLVKAPDFDLTAFRSKRTDRGPLLDGWMDNCRPVMTSYKLVIIEAPIWGVGDRVEDLVIASERALFTACHRLCFWSIDEWYGITKEQIDGMRTQNGLLLKKMLHELSPKSNGISNGSSEEPDD